MNDCYSSLLKLADLEFLEECFRFHSSFQRKLEPILELLRIITIITKIMSYLDDERTNHA